MGGAGGHRFCRLDSRAPMVILRRMRFYITTFGCQMNVHDSRWLSRALTARGWSEAPEDEADVFIINTCSVRDKPERKVQSMIGRLARHQKRNPRAFCAVGGCVAQHAGKEFLKRFPFVRLAFGTDQTDAAPEALERLVADRKLRLALLDFNKGLKERPPMVPGDARSTDTPGQAFVTIMQGCDNFCSYCIVPYVRGRQKSRPAGAILDECRALIDSGVREVTLLGQNVNSYGLDKWGDGTSFAELLSRVARLPGMDRVRFTTSHPKDLDEAVVRAFAELETLSPHLHLPLQSGSDRVLEAMGRGYDTARYMRLVDALRRARPDMALTTDLIVGFPGETEEDFRATCRAVEAVGYESSFSFIYSDRPGTRASRMGDKVAEGLKVDRLMHLQALQDGLTDRAYGAAVGREVVVLAEGRAKKQDALQGVSWTGHDAHGRVVNFVHPGPGQGPGSDADDDLTGRLVRVRVREAKKHSLKGEGTGEAW